MFEHTCRCIWFIWLSGFDWKFKMIKIAFANEIKDGFEIKEKKIRKMKEVKKLFSKNLLKIGSFMFELKSVF